jgi:hypothetical protein
MGQKGGSRGQSQVIGAVLIFGFVIAGLGLYQVTVVPQQTSEVELQHSETVKDDFSGVHGAIVEAGSANDVRTASVKLGTRYPPRALTLNPSPAYGRTAIDDLPGTPGISASFGAGAVCGTSATQPKTLTYSANYNRFRNAGTHGYETSVTYHAVDGKITDSSQVLVQGTTIRLLPLVDGSLSTSAITRKTLEFEGGTTGGTTLASAAPTITLPTELSKDQWKTVLEDANKVDTISKPSGSDTVTITFKPDTYTIRCTPIGEGTAPSNSPAMTPGTGGGSTGSGPGGVGINPNDEGEVVLVGTSAVGADGSKAVSIDLEYRQSAATGLGSAELIGARANYLYTGGPGYSATQPGGLKIRNNMATLDIGGEYVDFTEPTTASPFSIGSDTAGGTTVNFEFENKIKSQNYYVITFTYEYPDGSTETSSYFVSHRK